jgi:GNAT superfamily N-acetyltransferase
LHRAAFPEFFLSTLGESFLVQFYRGFLTDETAVTVVARSSNGSVQGAAVGTTEPARFYGRLVRKRWARFAVASGKVVVTDPRATPRLLRAIRYRGNAAANAEGALLSSICVDPLLQGTGVGRQLIEAWTRDVASQGVPKAFLTTDAENNHAINRFYQAQGWVLSECYTTRERRAMNRYTILLNCDDA